MSRKGRKSKCNQKKKVVRSKDGLFKCHRWEKRIVVKDGKCTYDRCPVNPENRLARTVGANASSFLKGEYYELARFSFV